VLELCCSTAKQPRSSTTSSMATEPIVVPRAECEQAVTGSEAAILDALSKGFVDFSKGKVEVATPSHMSFSAVCSPGEACIKTGCVRASGRWTVKVASTFHNNALLGLSNSQGVMLVFKEKA
jgi:ornithine cyclodeaminase/alanine dehydrogenase-like protein (mu-crystallin family)